MSRRTRRPVMARRLVLSMVLLAAVFGCDGDRPRGRRATAEQAVTSPTGKWSATLVEDGEHLRPTISPADGSGPAVWTDDVNHVPSQPPGVLWESERDVLWILSVDLGHASVRLQDDGTWLRVGGTENMPEDVAEIAG